MTWELPVIWLCSLVTFWSVPLINCDVPPSHNHGPIVMGIPNDNCDNAQVSLSVSLLSVCLCVCVCACVCHLYLAFVLAFARWVSPLAAKNKRGRWKWRNWYVRMIGGWDIHRYSNANVTEYVTCQELAQLKCQKFRRYDVEMPLSVRRTFGDDDSYS